MADKYIYTRLMQKVDSSDAWARNNPILKNGEMGYESNTHKVKIGNGKDDWNTLPYVTSHNAELRYQEIISRGENLVVNGNGFLGDNTNFSRWTFDGTHANGSNGSFTRAPSAQSGSGSSNYKFPINPSATYEWSADFMSNGTTTLTYGFLNFYDVDGKEISASQHMYMPNTLTALTEDLKPGDTIVHLENLDNWGDYTQGYRRSFIFWNYTNSFGYTYPPLTYSRNYFGELYTDWGKVNKIEKTITLAKPWNHQLFPKGTKLSQGSSGNTYKYAWYGRPGPEWETHKAIYAGTDYSGTNAYKTFPPGTATASVGFLWNYDKKPTAQVWVTNISTRESRANALSADKLNNQLIITTDTDDITFDGSEQTIINTGSTEVSKITNPGTPTTINFTYKDSDQSLSITPVIGTTPEYSKISVLNSINQANLATLEEPVIDDELLIVPEELRIQQGGDN